MYAITRQLQADLLADEVLEIADDVHAGNVAEARVRIDARKWRVSVLEARGRTFHSG